jgi:hypothetical protein
LPRPTELDQRVEAKKASSFCEPGKESFGCNLNHIGTADWDYARLIFSDDESEKFPGEKELVAFWYDGNNSYDEFEDTYGKPLGEPKFENVL